MTAALAPAVALADPTAFGTPTASSTFDKEVDFDQPVELSARPDRVEVLLTTPGAPGPNVTEVPPPSGAGSQTLHYALELADGHLFPNTKVTAQWRLTFGTASELGPAVSVLYADTRFDWKTKVGSIVRVHWYTGDDAFGTRALAIAEKGIETAEAAFGVTETAPVDFYVYADQVPFYDALGPGTRENVGGEAVAEIRTMFALIGPDEVDASWVSTVIPHELTHLVFNTAVKNPYHFPPRWLNEGLAVYLSQGYDSDDQGLVAGAAGSGAIMPLTALVGQFPTNADRFYLAYAESVSAVDYLIKTDGQTAVDRLIAAYATGVTDDAAFTAAIGMDMTAFDAAWQASIHAKTPVKTGPQPAPAGPLPPGWSGSPPAGAASPGPGSSGAATTPINAAPAPAAPADSGPSDTTPIVALGIVLIVAAVIAALWLVRRRRTVV
ncbi:MAG: peptidase MA family metallohydrolase [Candidatus Limnocylindrales bacterium]